MPLLPHLAVTVVVIVAVLVVAWWVLRDLSRTARMSTVAHELGLCRDLVAAGQFTDARRAHGRAEAAHRRGDPVPAGDVELLALGPMVLLEPQPVRIALERHDPLDLIGTATMRSVVPRG